MEIDINAERILREAASEVFETMVFMDVNSCKSGEEDYDVAPGVLSTVSFSGDYGGVLALICSKECAKAITINLLALDDEDEMEDCDIPDTMGEIANMTMGSVKSRLYEKMGELNVSVPSVIIGDNMRPQARDGSHMDNAFVKIDGQYSLQLNLTYVKKDA